MGLRVGMRTGMTCETALLTVGSVLLDKGLPWLDIHMECIVERRRMAFCRPLF